MLHKQGTIIKVAGPLVVAKGMEGEKMFNVVRVSDKNLIGEIVALKKDLAYIQVYEDTYEIGCGEPVYSTGEPLSIELGPGLLGSIYDGIQRPLDLLEKKLGHYITRGIDIPGLDHEKKWEFTPVVKIEDEIEPGDILGTINETKNLKHRILAAGFIGKGKIKNIKNQGQYTIDQEIAEIENEQGKIIKIKMYQKWPVRQPRPFKEKIALSKMMITGQRVIDAFFPLMKGGTACCPGPFGAGKTILQHALAKWSDADIIIFVGCGERGNEMTDLLTEFAKLKDPRTGQMLLERSVLVANTSNMPVAAREASIYTGITIAEYFRDMGYDIALTADSTSRWAEALREMSGRLEEMPGEEGYPAYLASRTASFYERAGQVRCLGTKERQGSVTIIGAVSPPGGDFSEPVTQSTLRTTKVFWELNESLAHKRHFPAINWLNSYSLYRKEANKFFEKEITKDWIAMNTEAMDLLQKEAKLREIALLVGIESLVEKDKLILQTAKSIREDFLIQNAFDEIDSYTCLKKQYLMLKIILTFFHKAQSLLKKEIILKDIDKDNVLKEKIAKMKYVPENRIKEIEELIEEINKIE